MHDSWTLLTPKWKTQLREYIFGCPDNEDDKEGKFL